MITVDDASDGDIVALVELESALFREDSGRHDPYADTTWPERAGHQDLADLIDSPDGLVLVARRQDEPVGLLGRPTNGCSNAADGAVPGVGAGSCIGSV